jgi:hypothetical protein
MTLFTALPPRRMSAEPPVSFGRAEEGAPRLDPHGLNICGEGACGQRRRRSAANIGRIVQTQRSALTTTEPKEFYERDARRNSNLDATMDGYVVADHSRNQNLGDHKKDRRQRTRLEAEKIRVIE